MGDFTGNRPSTRVLIDRPCGRLDTLDMVYSPRNMIFYALGFLLMGGGVVLWFKWSEPDSTEANGETLPDVYNVL